MIEYLYISDMSNKNSSVDLLRQSLKNLGFKENEKLINLHDIGLVVKYFMGETFEPLYHSDSFQKDLLSTGKLARPIRELFLWTLLTKRIDLAQLLWGLEKETLAAALFAANILRSMAKYTGIFAEKDSLNLYADIFENKAMGVIDECYNENPTNTKDNLIRELQFYGKLTCIELAADANSIRFIGHKACQELLDQIWRHSMDDNIKTLELIKYLIIGITFPILIPFVVNYKPLCYDSLKESQKHETASANKTSKTVNASKNDISITEDISFHNFRFILENFQNYIKRILDFYSIPIIKFSYNTIFYIIYLLYFTVMLLTRLQVTSISVDIPFIMLIIWTLTLAIDETRQALFSGLSFKSYLSNIWNKLDILAHSFFIIATICYVFSQMDTVANSFLFSLYDLKPIYAIRENILRLSRFTYGISVFFFIFRIMQIFSINSNLGPKIVMIQTMIDQDLGPFIAILFVFMISYAVTLWTVAFTIEDSRTLSDLPKIVFEMFRTAYFQIIGDMRVDVLNLNISCSSKIFMCDDTWGKWCSPIILAIYSMLSNVLLLNLLVAMFSNTYEIIQSSSNQHWALQKYQLMREYSNKAPIPPPFILIWQIYYFISKFLSLKLESDTFKKSYKDLALKEKQLIQWEYMRALDYIRSFDAKYNKKNKSKVIVFNNANSSTGQMGGIKRDLDSMKQNINERLSERLCHLENRLVKLNVIENNLDDVKDLLKELTISFKKNKRLVSTFFQERKENEYSGINKLNISKEINDDFTSNDNTTLFVFLVDNHFIARLSPIINDKKENIVIKYFDEKCIINPWHTKMLLQNDNNFSFNPLPTNDKMNRQNLPLLGINQCIHLIISRWMEVEDDIGTDKPVLQIVSLNQNENLLELPFFLVEHNDECILQSCIPNLINRILENGLKGGNSKIENNSLELEEHDSLSLMKASIHRIHQGYIEDFRNSDTSWIETVAYSVHQEYNQSFSNSFLKFLEFDELERACWVNSSDTSWLNPGNIFLIEKALSHIMLN